METKKNEIVIKIDNDNTDIRYISEWQNDFDRALPKGSVIVNKSVCGCGLTNYYLSNKIPVILASPRLELINSKINNKSLTNLFYYDRTSGKETKETDQDLLNYLNGCCYPPKILVTYDSLGNVLKVVNETGFLDQYCIVVDEFTSLFTDARLKGHVELKVIKQLRNLKRVLYISATPVDQSYLSEVDVFKDLPYVRLEWAKVDQVTVWTKPMRNAQSQIRSIIHGFKKNGYFEKRIINGKEVVSKTATFYLNSVDDILSIVEKEKLTDSDTRIICADNYDNVKRLREVNMEIGHFPTKERYRMEEKSYTFVTRACFEGADQYSDDEITYVFADPSKMTLGLDISIDLYQIAGRCRTTSNPFRNDIFLYFKTLRGDDFDPNELYKKAIERMDRTKGLIQELSQNNLPNLRQKLLTYQTKYKDYSQDYLDIDESTGVGTMNNLVYIADRRAVDILMHQYTTKFSLCKTIANYGSRMTPFTVPDFKNPKINIFFDKFKAEKRFEVKMEMYLKGILDTEIKAWAEWCLDIDYDIKRLSVLGYDACNKVGFQKSKLERLYNIMRSKEKVKEELYDTLQLGKCYTNKQIKDAIQRAYDFVLGYENNKHATATEIADFYDVESVSIKGAQGYEKGYRLCCKK